MPRLDIDMFDDTPKVGDKIKVMGKVDSINEDTGEVEVTYDDVSIVQKRKKNRRDNDEDEFEETVVMEDEVIPQSQSLDSALSRAFPTTQ